MQCMNLVWNLIWTNGQTLVEALTVKLMWCLRLSLKVLCQKRKSMFREIDEIRMVECNHCWGLVMCSWGLFPLFSLLYWIWQIYIIKKKCYFRGRILVKGLDYSHCLYNSGESGLFTLFSPPTLPFHITPIPSISSKLVYWTPFCTRRYSGTTSLTRCRYSYYSHYRWGNWIDTFLTMCK